MHVFISSPTAKVLRGLKERRPDLKLNILLTAARLPREMEKFLTEFAPIIKSIAFDNGAFSAINSKLDITVDQLITRFTVHSSLHQDKYLMVFSPDFNFGPDGFEQNYEELLNMEDAGIVAVPVIHNLKNHEAWSYSEDHPEFIAIGQSKRRLSPSNLFPVVFDLVEHHINVHLFGITDFELISGCPIFSCDSTSWLKDANTGVIRFWNPEIKDRNKTDIIYFPEELDKRREDIKSRYDHPYIDVFEQYLQEQLGLSMDQFIGSKDRQIYRQMALVLYYNTLEKVITELHLKEGFCL